MTRARPMRLRFARGQSATEFVVMFPVLLLLVFGIIQFGLLYQARATLNHATMLAARAGALHNGNRIEMRRALGTGLAPLFASEASLDGYATALVKANLETLLPGFVTLDVLNPTTAAMQDFGRARLDGVRGRELPNDTLNYRNTGPGSRSGISIQDANIIHVRVTYCVRLLVPVVDRLLYAAVNATSPTHVSLEAHGMSNPFGSGGEPLLPRCNSFGTTRRIPIRSEAFIRMQSPFYESNL
jgi:hypothetical protein